jgi:hypothetical protein
METIFNLLPTAPTKQRKPKMYRSKHNPKSGINSTFNVRNKAAGTMGRTNNRKTTESFTRSRRDKGVIPKKNVKRFMRPDRVPRRQKVPLRNDKPVMGLKTTKDFLVANAVENILAVPGQRTTKPPQYTKKKDYGKVPEYLNHVKEDIKEEKRAINEYFNIQRTTMQKVEGDPLPQSERDDLLRKLKMKWGEVNRRYQKIAHNTILDTIGKVKRKEVLERELSQLEKDIKLLSSKRQIIIV